MMELASLHRLENCFYRNFPERQGNWTRFSREMTYSITQLVRGKLQILVGPAEQGSSSVFRAEGGAGNYDIYGINLVRNQEPTTHAVDLLEKKFAIFSNLRFRLECSELEPH